MKGRPWLFCTFESILQLIIQVGLHFGFESRSLALSRVQSCHHGESYTLELHLLNLLLKLEFLHLPGSDRLLMSLLRDHETEVVLMLVLTLLRLEFPCCKNGAVLEPLALILVIEAFLNDVNKTVVLISDDIGSAFSGITRVFMG